MSTTSNLFNTQSNAQQKPGFDQESQQQPGYLQQAYEGATNLAATAASTVSGALYGDQSGNTTDTTTQYRNQQDHVGGVGDMGTTATMDVARVPEERANPEPYNGTVGDVSASNPAIRDPVNLQARMNARDPPVPYPATETSGAAEPSENQYRNHQPHVGGVGDMGTRSEANVAVLPEERANPNPFDRNTSTTTTSATQGHSVTGNDAFNQSDSYDLSTKGSSVSQGNAVTGNQDFNQSDSYDLSAQGGAKPWDSTKGTSRDITHPAHSGGYTGSNQDTDHGLGMPHREGRNVSGRDEPAVTNLPSDSYNAPQDQTGQGFPRDNQAQVMPSANQDDDDDDDEGGDDSTGQPRKRDKIKGTLLAAKGKLTKNQDAIDQGNRLKETGQRFE